MQHYDRIADLGREPSVDVESIGMEHRVDTQAELSWTCEDFRPDGEGCLKGSPNRGTTD
jgi:hypothetical protein